MVNPGDTLTVSGIKVFVESPRGSMRSGTDKKGQKWESKMPHHYGYIVEAEGVDGEKLDAFVGPNLDAKEVFVVNQVCPHTKKSEEDKVMLGFSSADAAKQAFHDSYDKRAYFGGMVAATVEEFKQLRLGSRKKHTPEVVEKSGPVNKDKLKLAAAPSNPKVRRWQIPPADGTKVNWVKPVQDLSELPILVYHGSRDWKRLQRDGVNARPATALTEKEFYVWTTEIGEKKKAISREANDDGLLLTKAAKAAGFPDVRITSLIRRVQAGEKLSDALPKPVIEAALKYSRTWRVLQYTNKHGVGVLEWGPRVWAWFNSLTPDGKALLEAQAGRPISTMDDLRQVVSLYWVAEDVSWVGIFAETGDDPVAELDTRRMSIYGYFREDTIAGPGEIVLVMPAKGPHSGADAVVRMIPQDEMSESKVSEKGPAYKAMADGFGKDRVDAAKAMELSPDVWEPQAQDMLRVAALAGFDVKALMVACFGRSKGARISVKTVEWAMANAPETEEPSDNPLDYPYGGIPEVGGYGHNSEYEVGIGLMAESAHCILGSLYKDDGGHDVGDRRWERGHIEEEMKLIESYKEEYSRPLYITPEFWRPSSAESMVKASAALEARAAEMQDKVDNVREDLRDLARACYVFLENLARVANESIVNGAPAFNAVAWLGADVKALRAAVDAHLGGGKPVVKSMRLVMPLSKSGPVDRSANALKPSEKNPAVRRWQSVSKQEKVDMVNAALSRSGVAKAKQAKAILLPDGTVQYQMARPGGIKGTYTVRASLREMLMLMHGEDIRSIVQALHPPKEDGPEVPAVSEPSAPYGETPQAPNGKPSRLNAFQWKQVRTAEFKAWFGDWEAAARQKMLEAMPPIEVKPLAVAPEALLGVAKSEYRKLLSESVWNVMDGRDIGFAMSAWREVKNHSADRRVLDVIPELPEILRVAVPLWSEPNTDKSRPNVKAFHNYAAKVTIGGRETFMRLSVKEDNNGQLHYDHDVTSSEIMQKGTPEQPTREPNAGEALMHLSKNRLYQWWQNVKNNPASRVVDENGEPLPVHHGTLAEFTVFDKDAKKGMSLYGGAAEWLAHFFSESIAAAKSYPPRRTEYVPDAQIRQNEFGQFDLIDGKGNILGGAVERAEAEKMREEYITLRPHRVISGYLSIKNPKVFQTLPFLHADMRKRCPNPDVYKLSREGMDAARTQAYDYANWMITHGYDGVMFKEGPSQTAKMRSTFANVWGALDSTQIKSATGNNGDFSKNRDIRKHLVIPLHGAVLEKAQLSLFPGMALLPAPKNPNVNRWQQTVEQAPAAPKGPPDVAFWRGETMEQHGWTKWSEGETDLAANRFPNLYAKGPKGDVWRWDRNFHMWAPETSAVNAPPAPATPDSHKADVSETPKPAQSIRFVAYRIGSQEGKLENRNAANLDGMAKMLMAIAQGQNKSIHGDHLHVYNVDMQGDFGDYQAYDDGSPWCTGQQKAVGKFDGPAVDASKGWPWYSFPKDAPWKAEKVATVKVKDVMGAAEVFGIERGGSGSLTLDDWKQVLQLAVKGKAEKKGEEHPVTAEMIAAELVGAGWSAIWMFYYNVRERMQGKGWRMPRPDNIGLQSLSGASSGYDWRRGLENLLATAQAQGITLRDLDDISDKAIEDTGAKGKAEAQSGAELVEKEPAPPASPNVPPLKPGEMVEARPGTYWAKHGGVGRVHVVRDDDTGRAMKLEIAGPARMLWVQERDFQRATPAAPPRAETVTGASDAARPDPQAETIIGSNEGKASVMPMVAGAIPAQPAGLDSDWKELYRLAERYEYVYLRDAMKLRKASEDNLRHIRARIEDIQSYFRNMSYEKTHSKEPHDVSLRESYQRSLTDENNREEAALRTLAKHEREVATLKESRDKVLAQLKELQPGKWFNLRVDWNTGNERSPKEQKAYEKKMFGEERMWAGQWIPKPGYTAARTVEWQRKYGHLPAFEIHPGVNMWDRSGYTAVVVAGPHRKVMMHGSDEREAIDKLAEAIKRREEVHKSLAGRAGYAFGRLVMPLFKSPQMSMFPGMQLLPAEKNPMVRRWQQTTPQEPAGTPQAPAEAPEPRNAWQMTREAYVAAAVRGVPDALRADMERKARHNHFASVLLRVDAGSPVSPDVLATYPELAAQVSARRPSKEELNSMLADANDIPSLTALGDELANSEHFMETLDPAEQQAFKQAWGNKLKALKDEQKKARDPFGYLYQLKADLTRAGNQAGVWKLDGELKNMIQDFTPGGMTLVKARFLLPKTRTYADVNNLVYLLRRDNRDQRETLSAFEHDVDLRLIEAKANNEFHDFPKAAEAAPVAAPEDATTYAKKPDAEPWEVMEPDFLKHMIDAWVHRYERGIAYAKSNLPKARDKDTKKAQIAFWQRQLDAVLAGNTERITEPAKELYVKAVKKALSTGKPVPKAVVLQRPEFQKALDGRARYDKGQHTSFANQSAAVNAHMQEARGYKVKRQDGTTITPEQIKEIGHGVKEVEAVLGPMADIMRKSNLTIAHTNGKQPFMRHAGGLYSILERTISMGTDGCKALAHELGHWMDYEAGNATGQDAIVFLSGRNTRHVSAMSEVGRHNGGLIDDARNSINAYREVKKMEYLSNAIKHKGDVPMTMDDRRKFESMPDSEKEKVRKELVRLGTYWKEPREIFARLVEQYISTKLAGKVEYSADADYTKRPGWWTAEQFAELMPRVESEIKRRLDILRLASGKGKA